MSQRYPGLDPEDARLVQGELEAGHQVEGQVPVTETVVEDDETITIIDHT